MTDDLLQLTPAGLYCRPGEFYIDPRRPAAVAVATHAHADHARRGCGRYFATSDGRGVLQSRLGPGARVTAIPYGEAIDLNGVAVSLHPAGHVLGSAQVRVAHRGETWVVSGDYKTEPDPTCRPFTAVACDVFITESTFGRPAFRWPPQDEVFAELNAWRRTNRDAGRASVVYAYAFGKSQRVLAHLDRDIGPIFCHPSVAELNAAYRDEGIDLPEARCRGVDFAAAGAAGATIVAPSSAAAWVRRFGEAATAFASGWMLMRGATRRWNVDRGFVISDHADWPGLQSAIRATGAGRVLVAHGYVYEMVRALQNEGVDAAALDPEEMRPRRRVRAIKPARGQRTLF